MESIELLDKNIPEVEPETVKENDDVIKGLYEVGAKISEVGSKITDVIAKMTEMSEKLENKEPENTDEIKTEVIEESEDNE